MKIRATKLALKRETDSINQISQEEKKMSRTIEAIERHMIPRSSRLRPEATAGQAVQPMQNGKRKLVAEWQRGVEILGHAQQNHLIVDAVSHARLLSRKKDG